MADRDYVAGAKRLQQTDARRAAVNHLTTRFTAQALASVIVDALAVAGSTEIWDDGADLLDQTVTVFNGLGLPLATNPDNVAYWRSVTGDAS